MIFCLQFAMASLVAMKLSQMLQECIPVGCVPSAAVAVSRGWGVCLPRGCLPGCVHPQPEADPLEPEEDTPLAQRQTPPGPRGRHTPLDITLPQTSFLGGKNLIFFQALTLALTLTLLLTLAVHGP